MKIQGTKKTPAGKVTTEKNAARAWRRLYLPLNKSIPGFYCESYGYRGSTVIPEGLRVINEKTDQIACLMDVNYAQALNKALKAKAKQGDPNTVTIKRSTLKKLEEALNKGLIYNHAAFSLADMTVKPEKRNKRFQKMMTRFVMDRCDMEAAQRLLEREKLNQLPPDPVMLDDDEDHL